MPKRILGAVLALLFALYALPAAQAGAIYMSVDGQIVRIGKDGFICADNDPSCSTLPAADILWAQDNRVVYTTPSLQGGLKLVCETLGRRVATYADNIAQAVYCDANGLLYYISAAQPNVLYRCAPQHGISSRACMTPSNILQITPSLNGLLILCEGEQGEPAAWLLPADQSQPELAEFLHEFRFEGCAVQVNLEGEMHLLFDGMPGVSQYAGNDPAAVAMYGNALYYTKNTSWGGYTQLYSFRTDTETRRLLSTLREPMTGAIAANDQTVFLISASGTLIAVDAATGKQQLTTKLTSAPVQPQLYLMEDTLYIYGTAESGCTALQEAYGVSYGLYGPVLMPLFTAQPEPTPTPTPAPTPAPTPTPTPVPVLLKRGMRGDDVRLMQEALIELGYLDDKADGSFGSKTLRAVKLFQEAADLPQTGIVDNAMLDLLYADNAPVFDLYAPLMQGDIGLRVRDLQQQLYDHGYLAEVPDGEYGPNTASGVRRLQEELGLRQTGDMSATCMEYVYNGRMPYYSGYISLRKGSTGPRVNELQGRLQALGYPVNVTGVYDDATYNAVCLFEQIVGASQTGRAGVNMQKLLFSESAPVYTPLPDVPVITPEPIITPEPVIVTPEPVDPNIIGPGSPYEQMLDLQQKLFALGKITAADVTGQYNTATKYAIGTIQIEMRDQHGYSHIRSTGRADLDTQAFINDLYANMPPAPVITPAPEPEPAPQVPQGDVINGNSSPDVVFPLQQKLFALGYMTDPQSVSGRYDEETKNCVYFFQRDLNQYFGQNIALTGHIDPVTRQFIEDLYAQKDPSQLHMPPVLMAPQLQALADMLTASERELSPNSDKIVEPLDAVKWAQNILKKWGYYPQEYIPDNVYDQDVFNVIAALRADLCLNDPALAVDHSIAGVIDQPLFEYFKQMHLTDPSAIPEGCILRYKIW